jgi:hypothetical protein
MTRPYSPFSRPAAWQAAAILSLLALVGAAVAEDKVLVVTGGPKADVVKSFGLVSGDKDHAAANRTKLQAKLDAGPAIYPWFFPGVASSAEAIHFDNTLILPGDSGRAWTGGGQAGLGSPGGVLGSRLILRAGSSGGDVHATTFDDMSMNTLTSEGAVAAITVIGRDVVASDQYNSVYVSDGTNVLPGWYGIGKGPTDVADGSFKDDAESATLNSWSLSSGATYHVDNFGDPDQFEDVRTTIGAGTCAQDTDCLSDYLYSITYTVSQIGSGGNVQVSLGGEAGTVRNMDGTYTEEIRCGDTENAPVVFTFGGGGSATCAIDDVSVRTAAIDLTSNRWGVDRNWCTGMVTDGEGKYCPEIVRNRGYGTYHRGLAFNYRYQNSDPGITRGVCYHIVTAASNGIPTGKHSFHGCDFGYATAGILCGLDMAGAFSDANDWVGRTSGHADALFTEHCSFNSCDSAILVRNEQSVFHVHNHLHAINVRDSVFNFDSGGKLTASGIEVAGNFSPADPAGDGQTHSQCILRLGRRVNPGVGPYLIEGFSFDGGNNTRNPQLVVTNWDNIDTRANVTIQNGILNRASTNENLPLVDIQGGCKLRLRDIQGSSGASAPAGIWLNSIRLKTGLTFKPHVIVEGCTLNVTADPSDIIDAANCDSGISIEFFGNCMPDGTALRNGRYVTGDHTTGAWDDSTSGWSAPQ